MRINFWRRWVAGLCFVSSYVAMGDSLPAFPGAEGFGAFSQGGRGGQVYLITTLADYHPGEGARKEVTNLKTGALICPAQPAVAPEAPIDGSLRQAIDAEGPRTILFAVSGTIALKAPLVIRNPSITIAGQSAPGDGICLKHFGLLMADTHDVIVRYLRIRPGDMQRREVDGMSIGACRQIIVDHCSVGWGIDENLSVSGAGADAVTVQWCYITESLNDSVHSKGPHGMGSLIRCDGKVSFHHNLYAMNNTRNPRPGTYGNPEGIYLDFRNNYIYNWGAGAGYSAKDPANINYIANYLEPGPASKNARRIAFTVGGEATRIYSDANLLKNGDEILRDSWAMIDKCLPLNRLAAPFPVSAIHTDTAEAARKAILDHGGASRPARDAVDRRVLEMIAKGTGKIIDSQEEIGGWPELTGGKAPIDSDKDGLPDAWEKEHHRNPEEAEDGAEIDSESGYTWLEIYLNSLAKE